MLSIFFYLLLKLGVINFTLYWQMPGKPWCLSGPDPGQDKTGTS